MGSSFMPVMGYFSLGSSDLVQTLGETAFLLEIQRQAFNLAAEERAGNCQEHQGGIGGKRWVGLGGQGGRCGHGGRWVGFGLVAMLSSQAIMYGLFRRFFHPGRHVIGRLTAPVDQCLPERIASFPLRKASLPQEVLVVEFEFLQAGAGHLSELEFNFFDVAEACEPSAIF